MPLGKTAMKVKSSTQIQWSTPPGGSCVLRDSCSHLKGPHTPYVRHTVPHVRASSSTSYPHPRLQIHTGSLTLTAAPWSFLSRSSSGLGLHAALALAITGESRNLIESPCWANRMRIAAVNEVAYLPCKTCSCFPSIMIATREAFSSSLVLLTNGSSSSASLLTKKAHCSQYLS